MDSPGSNIPEYTVGELSGAVKRTLEGAFGRVRVKGEITECKAYGPTRFYFSLKDQEAGAKSKLAAVVWSWTTRTGLKPENGTEVIATGRLTAYGDRSSYQLVVDRLEYAGAGAMLARIEALKAKLLAEGLFDEARKRPVPLLPRIVAVVTSAQGAVIQDIRTTVARRFPRPIQLWPVPVQGDGAAERIAAALRAIAALPEGGAVPRPDVVILARGGGGLEDLMAFNEEVVVRAVAAMRCPIITAVGHETDTTLVDFASDLRAPTPTAAAELAVPSRAELLAEVEAWGARLSQSALARLRDGDLRLERAARRVPDLPAILGTLRQRLDDRGERLRAALPALVTARRVRFARAQVPNPRNRLTAALGALALIDGRVRAAFRSVVQAKAGEPALARLSPAPVLALARERRARLEGLASQMEALSHARVLLRGYAMVGRGEGRPVTAAAQVAPGDALTLCFHDGEVRARAEGGGAEAREGTRRRGATATAIRPETPERNAAAEAAPEHADEGPGDPAPDATKRSAVRRRSQPNPAQETLL